MIPILRLDKVCKRFGGVITADNVSFSLKQGEIHGLIGPNGAGKSTIMNLISGIYFVDGGNVYLNEEDITNMPSYMRARKGVGRTFQTPRFLQRSSIRDNLLLGTDLANQFGYLKSYFGKKVSNFENEVTDFMRVLDFTFEWDADITSLTYGQLKQLEIIRSLLSHPKVILIDEPAAGLNNKEIDNIMELINVVAKKHGIGILLIEHSMDMIMNICEKIEVLNFGKLIASGTPVEISSDEAVIEAYLGRDLDA